MSSSGDRQERFLALFRPNQIRLERFVVALERDRERARDIVAETVAIAYERFDSLRHPEAFLSFLFTIARRVARTRSHEATRMQPADVSAFETLLDPATPPDALADIRALHEALDRLPQKQAEAVVLFELLGLSMKEIRDVQGGTLVSVRVRISRGRRQLAKLLGVEERSQRAILPPESGADRPHDSETTYQRLALPGKP